MDRQVAEHLVNELGRHSGIITPDKELFLDVLLPLHFPEHGRRFYADLPKKEQLLEEGRRYHYIFKKGFEKWKCQRISIISIKTSIRSFRSSFCVYSSDTLSRSLKSDPELVDMMAESEHPFSLLGKMRTYDYDNPDTTLFVISRPVLVIPDANDTKKISEWERANTQHEKEVGLLIRRTKRMRAEEYQSS